MTVENNQEEVKPIEDSPKTITVDVYGEQIEMPIEKAKQIIAKRDEKSKLFNEVSSKMKEYETKTAELSRKAAALEAARNGDVAAAEAAFNAKLEEKVSKYRNKVIEGELKSHLMSHPEFIGQEALPDVLALIKSQNNFELSDDDTIRSGEKDVKTIVDDFIKSKAIYRKAQKSVENKGIPRPSTVVQQKKSNVSLGDALKKFIEK